jgi:hypothetical protein
MAHSSYAYRVQASDDGPLRAHCGKRRRNGSGTDIGG